jgi:hypothetical protein
MPGPAHLKAAGIEGSLDQLRARAYVALLLGRPMPGPVFAYLAPSLPSPASAPCVAGTVSLTMPLSSFLGASGEPGEVAGFGPCRRPTAGRWPTASPASVAPAGASPSPARTAGGFLRSGPHGAP